MDDTTFNTSNTGRLTLSRYLESHSAAALTALVPPARRSGGANVIPLRETPPTDQPHRPRYEADRLFETYDRKQEEQDAALWSRSAMVLCARKGRVKDTIVGLSDDLASVNTCDCADSVMRYLTNCDGAVTIAALNIDLMDDLRDTVPKLLALRRANPELVIVIMSRTFAASDFSMERSRISDASVRLPTTRAALGAALRAAVLNTDERLKL